MAKESNLNIQKFLGLWHDSAGDTNIPVGALSQMQNFQVLPSFKLRKRSGYSSMLLETFDSPIRGQWYGKLNGKYYHLIAVGGKAYILDAGVLIELGDLDDSPTNIFQFGECVYFQDGTNYKRFTGIELVDENEVNFNSNEENGIYPKTLTLPAGKYRIQLGGGKGNPNPLNTDYDFGGKGGKISLSLKLDQPSTVEIRKITNQTGANEEYGASFWVLVDSEVYAAVGGGGGGSWYNGSAGGFYYNQKKGGDGGGDAGQDGTQGITEDGKGANLCQGGEKGAITDPSSTYRVTSRRYGEDGYNCDHPTKAGQGGLGSFSDNIGGCGYAGGGGGSGIDVERKSDSSFWFSRNGAGGGGSSFVKTSGNIALFENSRGTNNGSAYIKINTIREYFSLEDAGYAPLVYAGTKPDGTNGTAVEPVNNLSPRRRQQFNGDDTATVFKLTEKNNYSIYEVYVDGELQRLTDEYTVNGTNDEVTFITKPPTGANNVEIRYMKSEKAEGAEEISKHRFARVYGGKNDNRVVLYGNGNRLVFSDLADGIPSAEYFPVFNTIDVGTTQHDITGLTVQYDRMLIHKEVGTWWTHYDYDTNLLTANFPVFPLNDNIGCSYKGVERVCENNPFVLQNKQLYQFLASNVRDERNAEYLSERVQPLLDQLDFKNVRTLDYEKYGEYWIVNDNKVYIYNYRIGVWFYYYFAHNITSTALVDDKITLGTDEGDLLVIDGSLDDKGELINAFMETGWLDYGHSNIRKFVNFMWVQIFPESDSSAEVCYEVDRGRMRCLKLIEYKNLDFEDVDFADFTFLTNYNPKSFRLKPKAKKFVYVRFTIQNNKRNKLTLLGIVAPALMGGMSK